MKSIIFKTSEINKVNFSEVTQTPQTLVYNINKDKTYVTWLVDETPTFVINIESKEGPYSQNELLSIVENFEWLLIV